MKGRSSWFEAGTAFAFYLILTFAVPLFGWLFPSVSLAQGKLTRKDIPSAPLPASIVHAKKVFLVNGQTSGQYLTKNGNVLAFDTLYADIKSWGRYEVVDSPTDADIVIELQYRPYSAGSRSFSVYNPTTRTAQTRNVDQFGADFALVIYEAKSKEQLWSATDEPGAARLVKNQQKEVIKSIDRLVEALKTRIAP